MSSERLPSAGRYCRALLFVFLLCVPAPALYGDSAAPGSMESPGQPSHLRPKFYPFDKGEKALYQGSWLGVPVASAEIQTTPLIMNGKKFYHAKVEASTSKYLELIWKMRDSVESVFDAQTMQPQRFVFRQRENRKKIDTTASVDPDTKKWSVHRQDGKKANHFEFVSQSTLDPISAVYLARSVDFKVGDTLRLEVFGGKSRYLVALEIVGKEAITVRNNKFEAYKIVPRVWNITNSGYADRVRQATVWISADEKRTPVKIVSQAFIGSVNIELVEEKN
jgi:Protein of unknown function (DUF3108)